MDVAGGVDVGTCMKGMVSMAIRDACRRCTDARDDDEEGLEKAAEDVDDEEDEEGMVDVQAIDKADRSLRRVL